MSHRSHVTPRNSYISLEVPRQIKDKERKMNVCTSLGVTENMDHRRKIIFGDQGTFLKLKQSQVKVVKFRQMYSARKHG